MVFEHDLFEVAMHVAAKAHEGQLRKYTGEPYLVHPFAVAGLVRSVTDDDDMVIAALLHDVIEDSPMDIGRINGLFGNTIGGYVYDLTDSDDLSLGNRATRKAISTARLGAASASVQTIKCADLIDNTKSILAHDPAFSVVYMAEKRDLLLGMKKADKTLWNLAYSYVLDFEKEMI